MKWPVLVTTNATDPIRIGFAVSVLAYWARHGQADVHVLGDEGISEKARLALLAMLDETDYRKLTFGWGAYHAAIQRDRHRMAITLAEHAGARYVWSADDDVLPRPEMDLDVAAALLDAYPDYAIVALDLPSCSLPHGADGGHSGPIVEAGAVGGLRALRVEAFRDFAWPDLDPRMGGRYDVTLCTAITAGKRWKVGAFGDGAPRHLRAMHLGEYLSTFEWPYPVTRAYPRRWDE